MSLRDAIRISSGSDALAEAAAEAVAHAATESIRERGAFHLALSGGSTPRTLYQRLAASPHRERIDWSRAQVFWGDERCVPPAHVDSNYGMARTAMLATLGLADSQVHRIRGESPDATAEAERYAQDLRASCRSERGWPILDLVLLGMGPDGHTASLFPGTGAVEDRVHVALKVVPPDYVRPAVQRISLSAATIQAARQVIALIAGADKAPVLKEVIEGPDAMDRLPIQLLRGARGRVTWLLEDAAASHLRF